MTLDTAYNGFWYCNVLLCRDIQNGMTAAVAEAVIKTVAPTAARPFTTIVLNRPKRYNAMNLEVVTGLTTSMLAAAADPNSKATLMAAEGPFYSAGIDLSVFAQPQHPKKTAKMSKKICYDLVDVFVQHPKPIIGAVNGPIIGIAATTLALADWRIGVRQTTVTTPFASLGMAPEGCASFRFPMIMGETVAKQMLTENRTLGNGYDAMEAGFLNEVCENTNGLRSYAEDVTMKVIDGSFPGVPGGKRWTLRGTPEESAAMIKKLMQVNQEEVDILEKKWVSAECFEALAAYLSSRNKWKEAMALRALNKTRFLWDR